VSIISRTGKGSVGMSCTARVLREMCPGYMHWRTVDGACNVLIWLAICIAIFTRSYGLMPWLLTAGFAAKLYAKRQQYQLTAVVRITMVLLSHLPAPALRVIEAQAIEVLDCASGLCRAIRESNKGMIFIYRLALGEARDKFLATIESQFNGLTPTVLCAIQLPPR